MANPISQAQLSSLRSELEARQSRLRTEMQDEKSTPERTQSDSQDSEISYISDIDHEVDEGVNVQHVLELRGIEAALQRIQAGHYGICQDCGASIDINRLSAYPTARRCIDCKQAFELASANDRND